MHVAQIEGSIFIVLAIGDIFIVAGIILVILVVVGIIGAALSSKIVLCQVTTILTSNYHYRISSDRQLVYYYTAYLNHYAVHLLCDCRNTAAGGRRHTGICLHRQDCKS